MQLQCRGFTSVCLLFDILLHAARRAMAAACRCPRGQQRFSNPLQKRPDPVPNHCGLYRGNPFSSFPRPPDKRERVAKTKERDKRKVHSREGPARPPRSPAPGPHFHPCLRPPWPWPSLPTLDSPPSYSPKTLPPPQQRHPSTAISALAPSGAPTRNPFPLSATAPGSGGPTPCTP